ncbi:MAG: hypothetical protein C4289_17745, partial [Chloroflexota bacterium]
MAVSRPRDDDRVAENAALRQRIANLEQRGGEGEGQLTAAQQRIAELETALKAALEQFEAARRAGKRQAAPFSKGPPKENPQRPGQKAGHPAVHREKPTQVERTLEVKLSHAPCLTCGGALVDHTIQVQYQVAIPPVVTPFNVETARCAQGGQRSPEQTSDALGAAAEFTHGLGVPDRTVEHVLEEALGLRVAPGTLARAGQR